MKHRTHFLSFPIFLNVYEDIIFNVFRFNDMCSRNDDCIIILWFA